MATDLRPQNPDFEARARRAFELQPLHGGALASIADSAAGFAAFTLMAEDAQPLTVEYKLNTLRPGVGDELAARAWVIKAGRTLTVLSSDVYALRGDHETLCVTSIQTIIALRGRPDTEALVRDGRG